ncbi:MAG: acyl-CoA dehydrogenase [Rubrivivax sp.]
MNFDFSDEQNLWREQLRRFLVKESPLTAARRVMEQGGSHDAAVWQGLADLGVTSLMLPAECGGIGLGAMELCVVAEEAGRQLCPVPLASTLYLAMQAVLLGSSATQQQRWLSRQAQGEVATLAGPVDGELDAGRLPRWDGARLSGEVSPVADGAIAAWAVVLACDSGGALCWVLARLDDPSVARRPLDTLDPTRPFAALVFTDSPAEPLDAVGDPRALLQRVRARAAVLLAFEQLGAADAALDMACAYARERKAFGRTIGSYQGIKHKLVDIYTANQLARAHCYYGAWALATDAASHAAAPELPAAAAAARVAASQALTLAAQESIHVHGGMGVTWELDAHLYLRRARAQSAWLGHVHHWREVMACELEYQLDGSTAASRPATAAAARDAAAAGSMDFDDSPDEARFRQECREWLQQHAALKSDGDEAYGADLPPEQRMEAARDWQACKARAGYGAITWPQALGGRGGTPMQELIWRQEEARFKVPTGFFNVSLGMVLPSVMAHASQAVRERLVAPALQGRDLWCQLLSEPGAGSDLGMVRTRAQRCEDGRDGWLIHGQKVWTTLAQFAQYGLVLARTDPSQPKFDGLTTFFIDMHAPGVTVRPIRQMGGDAEFNEVFLENVFVPDEQRVGALGAGWKVTLTGLMSERLSIGGVLPADLWRITAQILREATFQGASGLRDGRLRERLADLHREAQARWLLQCRAFSALGKGRPPGPEMSVAKNVAARCLQAFGNLVIDLQGERGVLASGARGADMQRWQMIERLWFGAAGMRIAGGTDEIVKNNIGERVLGLAPEPRTDKGVPFDQLLA